MARGSVETKCEECGRQFHTFRAWLREGKAGKFCSRECAVRGRARRGRTMIQCICRECGAQFMIRRGAGRPGIYCSISCKTAHESKARIGTTHSHGLKGSLHPNWKGGISSRSYAARVAVNRRKRAVGKCERCGSTSNLVGHHVKPYAAFPELRELERNIEVLCTRCHLVEHSSNKTVASLISTPVKRLGIYKECEVCGTKFYSCQSVAKTSRFCSKPCQLVALHLKLRRSDGKR